MMDNLDAYDLLCSLGVSFSREFNIALSPEESLVSLIEDHRVHENRRLLSLTILVFDNLQEYFRPDLLRQLSKKMSARSCSIMGGVIFRDNLKSPRRWSRLKSCLKQNKERSSVFLGSKKLIQEKGADQYFKKFNILITDVKQSDRKKLVKDDWVLRKNNWFSNRILFGTGSRADIVTIRTNFLESNPYRVAKRFNCSVPSITKIWNDIIFAQKLGYEVRGMSLQKD